MDTVSLKSLVVEYEVPPSLIIEALNARTLHPKIIAGSTISFENVVFDHAEVAEVFKLYEWKYKTAEEKAELTRRLNRYDAIKAGVISAVIASGVTALGASALTSMGSKAARRDEVPAPADRQWEFHAPVEPPYERFELAMGGSRMHISMRPGFGFKFRLLAAEEGVIASARVPFANGIAVDHGSDWQTLYQVRKGLGRGLVPLGERVQKGQPLIAIDGSGIGLAEASLEIWRISADGEISNATFDVVIHGQADEAD